MSEANGGTYDEVEQRMQADFPAKSALVLAATGQTCFRLLDVGCGKGFFVKAAGEFGIDAQGIDVSQTAVEYATKILKVKATAGRIEDRLSALAANPFDVVTLWATIEHLPDPAAVLRATHACLKPGGLLMCDTGVGNLFWERLLVGHNQWYDAPQHLFVFSTHGISALLESTGFQVVSIDKNFDRSFVRRLLRAARHAALCAISFLCLAPLLGSRGFRKMQQEAKWPLGRLMSVVAKRI
jgi:SAM-dependent methyltransferase